MKYILLGTVLLFALTPYHEYNHDFRKSAADALIGTWKHTENEVIIRFDTSNYYSIQIGEQVYQWNYQLDPSSPHDTFYIDDSHNQFACKFDLISNNQLQLILINNAEPFDAEKEVATYSRVK